MAPGKLLLAVETDYRRSRCDVIMLTPAAGISTSIWKAGSLKTNDRLDEMEEDRMDRRTVLHGMGLSGLLAGLVPLAGASAGEADESGAVYELRVYTAAEGKLSELVKRFREHTRHLFERHGMKNVAYWTATDEPKKANTLVYILKFPSREAATASWKAFQDDPEWQQVRSKSEENGKLVEKADSTFMTLTDFSAKI